MIQLVLRIILLTAMSVAFCGLTVILGSAPLVALRNSAGRLPFFIASLCAIAVLGITHSYLLLVPFALTALLVFVYLEGIEHGANLFRSGIMALTLGAGASLIGVAAWARSQALTVGELTLREVTALLAKVPMMPDGAAIAPDVLAQQMPSAILIMMSLSLWMGTLFGKRLTPVGDSQFERVNLREFEVPETWTWLLILSLPGTFLVHEPTAWYLISVNVFNFMAFLYFLKGLTLIATYFHAAKTGMFWQGMVYLMMVSQLFLVVSLMGFADVWLNLKLKINKKSAESIER